MDTNPISIDGPYVMHVKGGVDVHFLNSHQGEYVIKSEHYRKDVVKDLTIHVYGLIAGEGYPVRLKKKLEREESTFDKADRIFVLSDIEGEWDTFRDLLIAAGVIDAKLNWIFGDGHLVLNGDFMDRGNQVNQVLWFIYGLEEKAKDAGGYVHFILGNHEIMNMSGDFRYVHPEYMRHAEKLHMDYAAFFGKESELGRWLRTKNVVEIVGNMLFAHGGVSRALMELDLSVEKINKLSRPYYDETGFVYPNERVRVIFGMYGPFWYRGYYVSNPPADEELIDPILRQYKVNHIATGHTIISDTVSALLGGRLFNTDVPHAKGHSEGLYNEKGRFFRVNAKAEKILIFP